MEEIIRDIPWNNRDKLPRMNMVAFVISTLLCVASSIFSITGNLLLILLGVLVSSSLFSCNIILSRNSVSFAAAPLSYLAALLITRSPLASLAALFYVPIGLLIAYSVLFGRKCTFAIIGTSVYSVAVFALLIYLFLTGKYGYENTLQLFTDDIKLTFTDAIQELVNLDDTGTFSQLLNVTYINEIVSTSLAVLPGISVLSFELFSALTVKTAWFVLKFFCDRKAFSEDNWKITISRAPGFIFIISYLVAAITGIIPSAEVVSIASTNIVLIFSPAVIYAGFTIVIKLFRFLKDKKKIFVIVLIIIVMLLTPYFMFNLIMFIGAFNLIRRTKIVIINDNNQNNDNNNQGGNDE